MDVSIITVCYNSEATIRKTIESVLAQTCPPMEYIIVDGSSSDGTLAVVQGFAEQFADANIDLRIVSEPDNGIYDAMNKGIRMARGQLVGIINSDDWYEPIALETAVKAMAEEPYDLFYADINLIRANGSILVKRSRLDRFPSSRHWNHPTTFITKQTYETDASGLYIAETFPEGEILLKTVYDDFDLILRLRKAGKRIAIRNVVLANFRTGGASNEKSLKKCVNRLKARYGYYRRNGYSRLYIFECVAMEIAKFILA